MTRTLLLSALAASALAGCTVQDDSSVLIGDLCAPTDDCTFSATCTATAMNGRLAVDLVPSGSVLVFPVQIDNQLPNNADSANNRLNTNDAQIEQLELRYQASGFTLPRAISNETHVVPAGGSTVIMAQLIPASAGAALKAALPAGPVEVIIHVRAKGQYKNGQSFETGEYPVPVAVSHGVFGPYTPANACGDATKKIKLICPNDGQTAKVTCE